MEGGVREQGCARPRKYTVGMILSFGPAPRARRARRGMLALGAAERSLPLVACCLAAAALPSARPGASAGAGAARRLAGARVGASWSTSPASARGVAGARFGFAPALSITLWLVLAVYVVESRCVPLPGVRRALAVLRRRRRLLALAVSRRAPPAGASPWAPLHWALGIASYGLFGAAVLHARHARRGRAADAPKPRRRPGRPGMPLLRLERLTFQFVAAGFVAADGDAAARLRGSPNPWRWDHKTVFSMLGWLVFAACSPAGARFGWRGRRRTRWLYAGAALLLLAYVGSRFVLEVRAAPRAVDA